MSIKKVHTVIADKHTRGIIFLVITVIIILALNSALPIIEGNAHYTANPMEYSYEFYVNIQKNDPKYQLTYKSAAEVDHYIHEYIKEHPEIPLEDRYTIVPPNDFKVQVYTRFFFQYPFWYITTSVHILSSILLFYSVFNFLITSKRKKDKKYLDLEAQVSTLTDNSLDPITFEPWMVNKFNKERKIAQHIANVTYELNELERKTKYTIRILAKNDPDNKKCAKYLRKKQELNSYLEQEYIDTYVVENRVKSFTYIHPSFVTSGVNATSRTTDSYSLISTDAQRLGHDSIKRVLNAFVMTTVSALLMTLTVVNVSERPWYWILLDCVFTLAPLLIQIPMAYSYCDSFMDTHLIPNLISRRSIALRYLAEMQQEKEVTHGEENSTGDRHSDNT